MKIIRFIKEFSKENKWGFLWSSIVISLFSLFIYVKDTTSFDVGEWIMWSPLPIGLLFIFSFLLGFFLYYGGFE